MEQFPHLKFIQKLVGKPRLSGGGTPNPQSEYNRNNREAHSANLGQFVSKVKRDWQNAYFARKDKSLAPLNDEVVPIFLQINPDILNAEFDLQAFGIEIISEENDGFIIGASVDNLRTLEEKINSFVEGGHGSGRIAELWQIISGNREEWKPQHILSDYLFERWSEIDDSAKYTVEVGIAFDKPLGAEPDPTKKGGVARLEKYRQKQQERDEGLMQRETDFEEFIKYYGEIISGYVELEDCFGCEVTISGKGLKDLVLNYPFVFEVTEIEEIAGVIGEVTDEQDNDLEILPPDEYAPLVGVVDSGIMENHRLLDVAIDTANSKSYLPGGNSTADDVKGGGHGTRVAGAILYPLGVSKHQSPYKLPCYIRNLRVLDSKNELPHRYPAALLQKIVRENTDCSLFNLSINSIQVHRRRHMSAWATSIDKVMFDNDVLFVVSAGNVHRDTIRDYIKNGIAYPNFLEELYCGIANPGQSCFAITVGSINHASFDDPAWQSLGNERNISAFSRTGPGIWNTVKPDVVEFGGGFLISKNGNHQIILNNITAPELLRSTLHGGSFNGFDAVGTSFAAPKVTHIASVLKKLYPNETINLLRALLVQGARLPDGLFLNPTKKSVKFLGYGIPSLDRVTKNEDHRISFYSTGEISAEEGHIYSLKIPAGLRNPGDNYEILIEVTLAYTAEVRRTRQKVKSYLSTWLDWTNSKLGEPIEDFKDYALKEIEGTATEYDNETRKQYSYFNWKIGSKTNSGDVQDFSRSNNTIQKDWTFVNSYELSEEIGFAIRGHKGWDKNHDPVPYAFVVSIEILGKDIPIYDSIRIENGVEVEIN